MGEKKKTPIHYTPSLYVNGKLVEQIYIKKENKSYYAQYDKKKNELFLHKNLKLDEVLYVPLQDEILQKEVVLLPSGINEYGTQKELENDIYDHIYKWLDISNDYLKKCVWYVILTWIIDNLNTIPYLRCLGDYGTGKTRFLDVIGGICYKPMYVGGSVRSAPIYRVIDTWRGTGIFDEFTLGKSDETEDIVQILNNGFQRGKPVLRCDVGRSMRVKAFDPFGAKILATRNTFNDKALESRCITEVMRQTNREMPIDLTETYFKEREELQNKLFLFRLRNLDVLKPDENIRINFGNVLPRIKQSFSPFTVLFQNDGKCLDQFLGYVFDFNNKLIEENASSFDGKIFNAYIELFDNHNELQDRLDDYHEHDITSTDIKNFLVDNEGFNADKLRASTIGKRLKSLGFESKAMKVAGKTKKILQIDDNTFNSLMRRYVVTAVTANSQSEDLNNFCSTEKSHKEEGLRQLRKLRDIGINHNNNNNNNNKEIKIESKENKEKPIKWS